MRTGFSGRGCVAAVLLCLAGTAAAKPIDYVFTTIASGPLFSTFHGVSVSMNNAGTVAFMATGQAGRGFAPGIFVGNGGPLTPIALGFTSIFTSINNSGTVAFEAGAGIFVGNGGPLTPIADTVGLLSQLAKPLINDAGTVAFSADLDDGGRGVFTGNGGPLIRRHRWRLRRRSDADQQCWDSGFHKVH